MSAKGKPTIMIPKECPYRNGSLYSVIWTLLYRMRKTGISRDKLLREAQRYVDKENSYKIIQKYNGSTPAGKEYPNIAIFHGHW